MDLKEILYKYIGVVCLVYGTIYLSTLLIFSSQILYIYIKKYIMFRRYKYIRPYQLRNINYGHFDKVINNRIQAMRNYVFIRDTWPYINKTIYGFPDSNESFEEWVEWVYNNYYENNLSIIQCLEDIIEGKTPEELISKTDLCVKRLNHVYSHRFSTQH